LPDPAVSFAVAFSPDGQLLAVGRTNGEITLHRIADGATVRVLPDDAPQQYGRGTVLRLAFSPDGSLLASSASYAPAPNGHMARVWHVGDGSLLWDFSNQVPYHHPHTLAFSRTGSFLLWSAEPAQTGPSSWDYRTIGFLDPSTGSTYRYIQTPGMYIWGAALSPDNSRIAAGASDLGVNRLLLWTLPDLALSEIAGAHGYPSSFSSVAFSPDGNTIASSKYWPGYTGSEARSIALWNVSDGSLLREPQGLGAGASNVCFTPDGAALVAGGGTFAPSGGGAIGLWRVSDGELLQRWNDPEDVGDAVLALTVSPDGAYIAYSRSRDGAVVLARNPYGPPPGPPGETSMVVSNVTGKIGQTVQLAARLTALGAGVAGKAIAFRVHGADVGQAVTDASGWAMLPYVVPEDGGVGNRLVEASFAGDASFAASDAAGALMVKRTDTKLLMLERSASSGDVCLLKGYLYRSTDRGRIGERSLAFSVDGSQVGTAVTDIEGRAVLPYMVPEDTAPGPRPIGVSWAGDADYYSSSTSSTLTVTKGSLYIWALQPRMASVGGSVYLRAYVRSWPGLNWKPGLPIVFSVDGTEVGTDTTNADGRASVLYTVPAEMAPGDHPFTCDFPGNATYDPASGGGILTVTP